MKLLMHLCCSNCSLYPLQLFLSRDIEVRGLWFNPNIHPLPEYEQRLASVETLGRIWGVGIEYDTRYDMDGFIRAVGGPAPDRCLRCYSLRLEETAMTAGKMGFDGFTSSLLVSPYQRFDSIVSIGEEAGKRHGIAFHAEDFRPGYRQSIPLSKDLGLYRQKYCGCLFSEEERRSAKAKSNLLSAPRVNRG